MRTDIVERVNLVVFVADDDEIVPTRVLIGSVIQGGCQFTFMAGDEPTFVEDVLLLFTEDRLVGIDPRVYKLVGCQIGLSSPLIVVSRHCVCLLLNGFMHA